MTDNGSPEGELVPHALMKALGKPLRAHILAILSERTASPKGISGELRESLSVVSYHVKALHESGIIELVKRVQRRGTMEHFYRAVSPTLLPPETWEKLPPRMREGVSAHIMREFLADAAAAAEAGVFDDPDGKLGWIPLVLDDEGTAALSRLVGDFIEEVLALQKSVTDRQATDGDEAPAPGAATVFIASFPSARDPREDKRASAAKMR